MTSFGDPASLERAFDGIDVVLLRFPLAPDLPAMARNAVAASRSGIPWTPDDAIAEMAGLGVEPWLAMLRDSMNRALAEGRLATKVDPVAAELILRPRTFARTFARDYAPARGAPGR